MSALLSEAAAEASELDNIAKVRRTSSLSDLNVEEFLAAHVRPRASRMMEILLPRPKDCFFVAATCIWRTQIRLRI